MSLRKLSDNTDASFIPVLMYILGLGMFGFMYWLMNGILTSFIDVGIHKTGNAYNLLSYIWVGIIIIYLVFGGIWLVRKYNEREYMEY